MAAVAENNTRAVDYWGRTSIEIVNVTASDTNTFASQWASVKSAWFVPTTAAAYGLTFSGSTVTFATGGALTGDLYVVSNSE